MPDSIPSPRIKIRERDAATHLCRGYRRTLDESALGDHGARMGARV